MNLKPYLFCLLAIFLISCNKEKKYIPEGLTKLKAEELIERAKQKKFINPEAVVYKNEQGETITFDSIQKIPNIEDWTVDSYVDENGVVKELVIRKATPKDKELREKIRQAFEYQPPIELIDINCDKKAEILQKVFDSDQNMRRGDGQIKPEIDRENLVTVVSLIEKCGMPTLEEVNEVQMSAIWVVFQHANNTIRKKYLPLLEKSAKNGDLEATQIAMMKDRTLMSDGKPQIYGTQVTKRDGEWVLYELKNPETVNKRRAEMGFGPVEDYLKRWDIEFNVEQLE